MKNSNCNSKVSILYLNFDFDLAMVFSTIFFSNGFRYGLVFFNNDIV